METDVTLHLKKTMELIRDWLELQKQAQILKARKAGIQAAVGATFGLFALVWAEVAIYLALSSILPPAWAAVATLAVNGLIVGIVFAVLAARKRQGLLFAAAHVKSGQAREEALAARDELVGSAERLIRDKVVVPYHKVKVPAALAGSFAVGLLVARYSRL